MPFRSTAPAPAMVADPAASAPVPFLSTAPVPARLEAPADNAPVPVFSTSPVPDTWAACADNAPVPVFSTSPVPARLADPDASAPVPVFSISPVPDTWAAPAAKDPVPVFSTSPVPARLADPDASAPVPVIAPPVTVPVPERLAACADSAPVPVNAVFLIRQAMCATSAVPLAQDQPIKPPRFFFPPLAADIPEFEMLYKTVCELFAAIVELPILTTSKRISSVSSPEMNNCCGLDSPSLTSLVLFCGIVPSEKQAYPLATLFLLSRFSVRV